MKLSNQILGWALGILILSAATGCGILPNGNSGTPTRAATQTPFIVFVPVTTTPEPPTVTPLATVTSAIAAAPTRTATRAAAVRPTATRTKTSPPVAAGPSSTAAPACAYSQPVVNEPDSRAEVTTKELSPGTGAIIFRWTPPGGIGGDDLAYKIQLDSKSGGRAINSDTVYMPVSKLKNEFIYDGTRVWGMKVGGEPATLFYYMSVVKFTGSINDQGYLSGNAVECSGSRTPIGTVNIKVQ